MMKVVTIKINNNKEWHFLKDLFARLNINFDWREEKSIANYEPKLDENLQFEVNEPQNIPTKLPKNEQLNMAAILELRKIFDETGISLSQEVINEREDRI